MSWVLLRDKDQRFYFEFLQGFHFYLELFYFSSIYFIRLFYRFCLTYSNFIFIFVFVQSIFFKNVFNTMLIVCSYCICLFLKWLPFFTNYVPLWRVARWENVSATNLVWPFAFARSPIPTKCSIFCSLVPDYITVMTFSLFNNWLRKSFRSGVIWWCEFYYAT